MLCPHDDGTPLGCSWTENYLKKSAGMFCTYAQLLALACNSISLTVAQDAQVLTLHPPSEHTESQQCERQQTSETATFVAWITWKVTTGREGMSAAIAD